MILCLLQRAVSGSSIVPKVTAFLRRGPATTLSTARTPMMNETAVSQHHCTSTVISLACLFSSILACLYTSLIYLTLFILACTYLPVYFFQSLSLTLAAIRRCTATFRLFNSPYLSYLLFLYIFLQLYRRML